MNRRDFEIPVPLFSAGAGVKGNEKEGIRHSSMCGARGLEAMRSGIATTRVGGKCYGN
jgi:hypothetical protein